MNVSHSDQEYGRRLGLGQPIVKEFRLRKTLSSQCSTLISQGKGTVRTLKLVNLANQIAKTMECGNSCN